MSGRAGTTPLQDRLEILREGLGQALELLREHRGLEHRSELIETLGYMDWALSVAVESDDERSFRSVCLDLVQLAWAVERPGSRSECG